MGTVGTRRNARPASQTIDRTAAISKAVVETLEGRQMLSVTLDPNGYTVVTPGAGAKVVYVSSSAGNDAASGLSEATPVKTIAKAKTLLTDGKGDQLLLKAGDTWNEGLGFWTISGKSADEPAVVGSYGTGARPQLNVSTAYAFGAGKAGYLLHDVVVQGIKMYDFKRDPANPAFDATLKNDGFYLSGNISNLTIDNVDVSFFRNNLTSVNYYGAINGITVRNSIISNSWHDESAHSQGMYFQGVDGITLERNTFDHNGWNEKIPVAVATIYNHNVYVQGTSKNLVARGNIFANAAAHGMQARIGGYVEDNTFVNNPIQLSYGIVNGSGPMVKGGVSGAIRGNVFIGGRDINGATRGVGIEIANTSATGQTLVEKNIFTSSYDGGGFGSILLSIPNNQNNPQDAAGLNNVSLKDNITYKWQTGLWVNPKLQAGTTGLNGLTNLSLTNNDWQSVKSSNIVYHGIGVNAAQETLADNRYFTANTTGAPFYLAGSTLSAATWATRAEATAKNVKANYTDPDRNLVTLSFALGGTGTPTDFIEKAKGQSPTTFNASYTAYAANSYIRAGFVDAGDATPAIPGGYTFTPTDPTAPTPPVTPPVVTPPVVTPPVVTPPTDPVTPPVTTPTDPVTPPVTPPTDPVTPPVTTPVDPGDGIPTPPPPPPVTTPTEPVTPTTPADPVDTTPGYHTEIGPDGKIIVVWEGGPTPGEGTDGEETPTTPETPAEPEPGSANGPGGGYGDNGSPNIVYGNGYWYIL